MILRKTDSKIEASCLCPLVTNKWGDLEGGHFKQQEVKSYLAGLVKVGGTPLLDSELKFLIDILRVRD